MLGDDMIALRAPEPDDLDNLYRWENDQSMWAVGISTCPLSRHQLWEYIRTYDADIFNARQLRLMIVSVATGETVGTVDLCDFSPRDHRAMVGMLVEERHRGKGIGRRALSLVEDYCRQILGMIQISAVVRVDNLPSRRLFDGAGYEPSGVLRSWVRYGNDYADVVIYQKLF